MLGLLSKINQELAEKVAEGLGTKVPAQPEQPMNHSVGADNVGRNEPTEISKKIVTSDALSMIKNPTVKPTIVSRKIAFICNHGVCEASVMKMKKALVAEDAEACIIGPNLGFVSTKEGGEVAVKFSFFTSSSVLFDAVYIPDGKNQAALQSDPDVMEFLNDAYRHCKIIGTDGNGIDLLSAPLFMAKSDDLKDGGIITSSHSGKNKFETAFINAVKMHRFWQREEVFGTIK